MTNRLYAIPLALAALAILAFAGMVLAENVDPLNNNSQFAWGENVGWLNAEPAGCGNCGVDVTNTGVTGYIWSENAGWINLSCRNSNACAGPAGNWGVSNNGSGALSGYAWAENAGWISFSCQNNPSTCAGTGSYGVSISPATGVFSGHAWGENLGWINFSDTTPVPYKVQTSDSDADGVYAGSDNCVAAANAGQANGDGDAFGDVCDACPATANPASCTDDDNDGYTDVAEGSIGTNPAYPCGNPSWPSDLLSTGPSTNKLDVQDIISFIAPLRLLDTSPNQNPPQNYLPRWDLAPGANFPFLQNHISIFDITTMLNGAPGSPAYPPMFGGPRAFLRECPLEAQ